MNSSVTEDIKVELHIHTLNDLLPFKDVLIEYLKNSTSEKGESAKAKQFIRDTLDPLTTLPSLAGLTDRIKRYKNILHSTLFDTPATHVWTIVAEMFSVEHPNQRTDALISAFHDAEHGLNATQIEQAEQIRSQFKISNQRREQTRTQDKQNKIERQQQLVQRQQNNLRKAEERKIREEQERQERKEQAEQARIDAAAKAVAAKEKFEKDKVAFLPKLKKALAKGEVSKRSFDSWAAKHLLYRGTKLTLANAVKLHGLSPDNRTLLDAEFAQAKLELEEQQALREQKAQAVQEQRDWRQSLLISSGVMQHLNITESEYKRWLNEKKLVPAMMKEFYKWGKTLEMPLFDPVTLDAIPKKSIEKWRAEHATQSSINRSKSAVKAVAKAKKTIAIKKDIALDNFANTFAMARALEREVHLHLGPTNSGKTHHAIEELINAKTGVYLAPLRLLALENYERLKAAGVAVSLLTGEERIIAPNATHVCATIEMCDFSTAVHIAVIDEIQMLSDPQRGWAWVSALVGVPAQVLYVCGAPYARDAVLDILKDTNETYTEKTMERLTPLEFEYTTLQLNEVKTGDAVIAFSRKDVLNFAAMLKQKGVGVSVIYGALSPEVRRRQAQLFIDGTNQVVVSTDAIGMGLNLPIRRIIFSASGKFDGVSYRDLYPHEVQQIAGRAGRFGLYEKGIVTAFGKEDASTIDCLLDGKPATIKGPYSVMPTWLHIEIILKHLGFTKEPTGRALTPCLELFARLKFKGTYQQAELKDTLARLEIINRYNIPAKDAFALACAPADPLHYNDASFLSDFAEVISENAMLVVPSSSFNLGSTPKEKLLEAAEAYSRCLALYSWFACKYPQHASSEGLAEQRQDLAEFIDGCLIAHKTVFFEKKKKQYHWRDDYDMDDDLENFM